MAIRTNPENFEEAPAVIVYSSAEEEIPAIKEIDSWAKANGFVRTRAYPERVKKEGRSWFKGICYRMDDDDRSTIAEEIRANRERVKNMQPTTDATTLLRDI